MAPVFAPALYRLIEREAQFRWLVWAGGRGGGKCLSPEVEVMMFDGTSRPVADVRVGDVLMGPGGSPRNVLEVHRGRGAMVEIVPRKGDPWRCTLDHGLTLSANEPREAARRGEVVDVPVRAWLAANKTFRARRAMYRSPVEFAGDDALPIDPYLLGVLLGDGGLTGSRPDGDDGGRGCAAVGA